MHSDNFFTSDGFSPLTPSRTLKRSYITGCVLARQYKDLIKHELLIPLEIGIVELDNSELENTPSEHYMKAVFRSFITEMSIIEATYIEQMENLMLC